ncbi:MAG TPA: bifunctional glutamate N-acetyltransferase/amino-acid acetyltransferase ArgJ, partial [Candidatus Limnocylindria bacterium]|nr:bifunctional glutamate N-acetyltransferase/amino-acid acetyltransferase ArgJ [Candidatus Limnocylindria bacterium]
MSVRPIRGGVTTPRGFRAAAARAGLRSGPGPDVALLVSDSGPVPAAATFTTNRLRAAPVEVAMRSMRASRGRVAAVIANAGCANAGTGAPGLADARTVQALVARRIGVANRHVFTTSTGLIGSRLAVDRIASVLPSLAPAAGREADGTVARAIMTTDTVPKEAAAEVDLGRARTVRIGGMAKGSGMIHPQMATMLAFLTTDAPVEPATLRDALRSTVQRTFNQVTVDGDPSTNDTALIMASGREGGRNLAGSALDAFTEGLEAVCRSLAEQIAADGEGAQHRIDVSVIGARDDREARLVARTVAASSLVKSAVHGADPNWGRIAAAAGRSGARLDPDRLAVRIGSISVYDGAPLDFDERAASRALRGKVVGIGIDLRLGSGSGMAWGCDLSAEYVAINSEY